MGINDNISKLGHIFRNMNIAEGVIFVTVAFPKEWKTSSDIAEKYKVKVMPTENYDGYYFAGKLSNGFDNIFNAIDETIKVNEVAGLKKALLIQKITELQKIFEDEPLDVLQTLEFKMKKKVGRKPKKSEVETEDVPVQNATQGFYNPDDYEGPICPTEEVKEEMECQQA